MTYRTMQGLGLGPTPTPDQIGMLLKAINTQGGCTATFKNSMAALPCLNWTILQWFGSCKSGQKPANITQAEYDGACASIAACGGFDKLGCPEDGADLMKQMSAQMPSCWTDAQWKDAGAIVDYCGQNPGFNGPNGGLNAACWGMSRYPDLYSRLMNIPRCTPPAPPPPPPPVVTAPPPTSAPSADQPTAVMAPDTSDMTSAPSADSAHEEGMSTTTMVVIGVGAVAVLGGLGYMLLRKK